MTPILECQLFLPEAEKPVERQNQSAEQDEEGENDRSRIDGHVQGFGSAFDLEEVDRVAEFVAEEVDKGFFEIGEKTPKQVWNLFE
jgi:hypothetical protein